MAVFQRSRGRGAETVMQRARASRVALALLQHAPVYVVMLAPPLIWAWVEGARDLALGLGLPLAACVALSVGAIFLPMPRDLRRVEAMVSVALLFALAPILTLPAFMALGMGVIDALFEGMSAITTTGLSVARDADDWPFAAHVLRSWMQWCGGLAMATAVLALILSPGLPARQLGRVGIDDGDRIASTRAQARQLLGVYVGLTVCMTLLIALFVPGWREPLVLTLSAVSTGGFAPRSDSLASYSLWGQGAVILACILGAISLLTYALWLRGRFADGWQLGSARRVLTAIVLLCGAYGVWLWRVGEAEVAPRLLDLISGLTTAGYSTGAMPLGGPALLIFLVAMAMGGDVGSTAGGLKLARIGTMLRGLRHAALTPRLPDSAVAPLRQNGKSVEDATLVMLLALVMLYLAFAIGLWAAFLGRGYAPLPALFDVVSTLSTVGLSTGVVGPDLESDLKLALTVAMLLGRLEFIAVLVLVLPGTWLKRR